MTYVGWRAINGLTPHWLRVVADAETADGRSRDVEQSVPHRAALEIRAVLLESIWNRESADTRSEYAT